MNQWQSARLRIENTGEILWQVENGQDVNRADFIDAALKSADRLKLLAREARTLCGTLSDAQDQAQNEFDDRRARRLAATWLTANRRMWRRLNQLKAAGHTGPLW